MGGSADLKGMIVYARKGSGFESQTVSQGNAKTW